MFKKPKFSKQNKFSGIGLEEQIENKIVNEKSENNNIDCQESKIKDIYSQEKIYIKEEIKKDSIFLEDFDNKLKTKTENESQIKNEDINNSIVEDVNDKEKRHSNLQKEKESIKKMLNISKENFKLKNEQDKEINLSLNSDKIKDISSKDKNNKIDDSEENYYDKIQKIKETIDKKTQKPKRRGIVIKPLERFVTTFHKQNENDDVGIKKIFISENDLKNTKNPEELKKLVGVKKEEIDKEKKNKLQKILDHQKDLFTLPDDLRVVPETKNDYVDNLIKLSAAGLIEVPLSLENKLKNIEETEIMKKQIIDKRLVEELDYLKVLKKLGPSYAKGYKNDLSHKKLTKLNNVFENVFVNLNGRKRKLLKEKMILDNRMLEEGYVKNISKKIKENEEKDNNIDDCENSEKEIENNDENEFENEQQNQINYDIYVNQKN